MRRELGVPALGHLIRAPSRHPHIAICIPGVGSRRRSNPGVEVAELLEGADSERIGAELRERGRGGACKDGVGGGDEQSGERGGVDDGGEVVGEGVHGACVRR